MGAFPLILTGLAIAAILAHPRTAKASSGASSDLYAYTPSKRYPFGKDWGSRLPPGLPDTVRRASVQGAALYAVEVTAGDRLPDPTFIAAVLVLAKNESQGTYALPCIPFNNIASPPTTAWGVFNWNRGAWQDIAKDGIGNGKTANQNPWDATAREEIVYPIEKYARLFEDAINNGATTLEAAYGMLLWHRGPSYYRAWRSAARSRGFSQAASTWWQGGPNKHREQALAVEEQLAKVSP